MIATCDFRDSVADAEPARSRRYDTGRPRCAHSKSGCWSETPSAVLLRQLPPTPPPDAYASWLPPCAAGAWPVHAIGDQLDYRGVHHMNISDPVSYLFKNADPRGSLSAN